MAFIYTRLGEGGELGGASLLDKFRWKAQVSRETLSSAGCL
jgi:hypothetical protein